MTLDLNDFRIQVPYIKSWLDNKPGWKLHEEIGSLALATGVPIVAVGHYIGELYGFTPELNTKIKRDMEFYQVTTILNLTRSPLNFSALRRYPIPRILRPY